jgi:predicted nucleic acid-binding protein
MLTIIADASSLILLAKCGLLETVARFFEIRTPPVAADEASAKDLFEKYPDAALIDNLISQGAIAVQDPGEMEIPIPWSIHQGEKEALKLMLRNKGAVLASDDGKAIKAARFMHLPFIITPKIVTELFRLKKIPFSKAKESLEKLGIIGRYSPEIIAEALIDLMEAKDG